MRGFAARLWAEESGATAIEYALIATFIALAIVTGLTGVGSALKSTFTNISAKL